jgi:hypothetical protein
MLLVRVPGQASDDLVDHADDRGRLRPGGQRVYRFRWLCHFFTPMIICGLAFPGTSSDFGGDENASLESVPVIIISLEPLPAYSGDENVREAVALLAPKMAEAGSVIAVAGVIQTDDTWHVILKDYSTGERRSLRAGEAAFGYVVKAITRRAAVLESAGREFELRVGESNSPWAAQWQQILTAFGPQEQRVAREFMRVYWRQQWEGEWGDAVRKMTFEEQERIRTLISSYWR